MILYEGTKLFHGSYCAVSNPDLKKCRPGKDFGRGFYLTTDRMQAVKFTRTSMKKAVHDGILPPLQLEGFVSEFVFHDLKGIKKYEFPDADQEWLHCVAAYRKNQRFPEKKKWDSFDVLCGKIANDNTNLVITAYIDGLYGKPGSYKADQIAIGFLEPENLKNQICLRTEKALACLEFIQSTGVRL